MTHTIALRRRGSRSIGPVAVVICMLGAMFCMSPAQAADRVTQPFRGVSWTHRRVAGTLNLHVLSVDLCQPGVSVRATASNERRRTVSSFGRLVGAVAAVNGDFFSWSDYHTSGLAVGAGVAWPDTQNDGFEASIAFGPGHAEVLSPRAARRPPSWVTQLVSSRPQILAGGVVQSGFSAAACAGSVTSTGQCARDPRTGIGLSRDRRRLVLAVVDGRQPSFSRGMTTAELANAMKARGAWDAVAMDSGGSAQMWIKARGIVNRPSDGRERVVANHLAIRVGAATDPALHCPATIEADSPTDAVAPPPAPTPPDDPPVALPTDPDPEDPAFPPVDDSVSNPGDPTTSEASEAAGQLDEGIVETDPRDEEAADPDSPSEKEAEPILPSSDGATGGASTESGCGFGAPGVLSLIALLPRRRRRGTRGPAR